MSLKGVDLGCHRHVLDMSALAVFTPDAMLGGTARSAASYQHRTRAPQRVAYLFGHTLQRDHQYELRPIDIPAMADCSPQLF